VAPAVALLNYMGTDTLSLIFPKLAFFAWFPLYIIIIAGRNSEAVMGGAGGGAGAHRPVSRVKEPKKMGACSARRKPTSSCTLHKICEALL
jgi:hypothetical protein